MFAENRKRNILCLVDVFRIYRMLKGDETQSMKLKNIPNILSMIRIGLVFVFVALFFTDHIIEALIVFLVAGATDIVDGYLARRYNWITNLGKILDPVADKLMQCTVLICLLVREYIPLWFVLPFIVKEVGTLCIGAIVIKRRNVTVVSKWYGKLTVCLFYLTIAVSILFNDFFASNEVIGILIYIPAAVLAIISFLAYIKHYLWLKNETPQKGNIIKGRKD